MRSSGARAGTEASIAALLRRDRSILAPVALGLFATYAYFVGPPAWNQNSRFALTRAIVEEGRVAIDSFHASTGDKSRRDGHFYSDKAPGASLLAVPVYGLVHGLGVALGGERPEATVIPLDPTEAIADEAIDPEARRPGDRWTYNQSYRVALYLCRALTTSVLAVVGVIALYLLGLRLLADDRRAALALALAYGLGTPALVYATAFYGHQPCADLLLLALAGVALVDARRGALAVGGALGLAVLCEYPAAAPALILVGLALVRRGPRYAGWVIAGGAPWALLLGAYHWIAFGSPLKTGYDFVYLEEFAEGMAVNYGIHAPDPAVLLQLLFGTYRGLFTLAPVMILAAWGLAVLAIAPRRSGLEGQGLGRPVAVASLAIVAFYLLLNAGYYMWDGGAAIGPRHCVPMLPFLALGLAPAIRAAPRAFVALAGLSIVQMIVAAAGAPEAPSFGHPIWGHAWPRLRDAAAGAYQGATNLGLILGLPGAWSLAPLALAWLWIGREVVEREAEVDAGVAGDPLAGELGDRRPAGGVDEERGR